MSGASRMSYRAWVDSGARGHFVTAGVTVNTVRLINPADMRGGYFVRRDTSDPKQAERRATLHYTDQENGERTDAWISPTGLRSPSHAKGTAGKEHRRIIAYDVEPEQDGGEEQPEGWVLTHRVERPAEVVRRGWLTWEQVGEVSEREPAWTRESVGGSK